MAQHCLFVLASLSMFLAFLAVGVGFFAPYWLGNVTSPEPGSGGGSNVEDPGVAYLRLGANSSLAQTDYRWRGLWAQCAWITCQWFWTNDFQLQDNKFSELSESPSSVHVRAKHISKHTSRIRILRILKSSI